MAELADTRDLKSLGSDIVPVQVRPPAPCRKESIVAKRWTLKSFSASFGDHTLSERYQQFSWFHKL